MTLLSKLVWVESGSVLSPVVGRLLSLDVDNVDERLPALIGEVEQLGRRIVLVTSQRLGNVEVKCTPPCDIFVGTCLAKVSADNGADAEMPSPFSASSNESTLTMTAPSDGYLIFTDDAGRPYFKPGDRVERKQNLALLELMKLRIAICYEGSASMRFLAYDAVSHQPIRKGQSICRLSSE